MRMMFGRARRTLELVAGAAALWAAGCGSGSDSGGTGSNLDADVTGGKQDGASQLQMDTATSGTDTGATADSQGTGAEAGVDTKVVVAPTALSYSENPAIYPLGKAIAPNIPT